MGPKCLCFALTRQPRPPVFIQATHADDLTNLMMIIMMMVMMALVMTLAFSDIALLPTTPVEEKVAEYNDSLFYIYTSGTTGE